LKLAHILVEKENRPGQALRVMGNITPQQLSEKERRLLGRLSQKAQKLAVEDPYEVVDEDW
jgi:hypothetical protein